MKGRFGLSAVLSLVFAVTTLFALMAYGVTEEVPLGSIQGVVTMEENGKPLPDAFVRVSTIVQPEDEELLPRRFETDKDGRFAMRNLVAGDYILTVSAKAHDVKRMRVSVSEGKTVSLKVPAKPKDYYLDLYASQRVFTPGETPAIQVKGFSPNRELRVSTYKLDMNKVLSKGGLYNALAPLARAEDQKVQDPATMGQKLTERTAPVSGIDAEGTFIQKLDLAPPAEGLYWVQCKLGNLTRGTWMSVSRISMVAKHVGRNVECFVTTIDKGEPIAGATIGYPGAKGLQVAAKTGANGVASFVLPEGASTDSRTVIVATQGDSQALTDYYQSGDTEKHETRIYTYTDRSIYKPGDLIQFKGIVRRLNGKDYSLPGHGDVQVQLLDEQQNIIRKLSLPLGGMGTYSGGFEMSKEAPPGNYTMVSTFGGNEHRQDIGLAAYRKPVYSITVRPEKPYYIRGDKVRMFVDVQYYYGGPVINAEVNASVYREPYYRFAALYGADDDESDLEEQSSSGGEQFDEMKAKTDVNGRAVIEFVTQQDTRPTDSLYSSDDYQYNMDVSVRDEGGKFFDGHGNAKVYSGNFDLSVTTDRYMADPGTPVTATVKAVRVDGTPLANTNITLRTGFQHWEDRKVTLRNEQTFTVRTGPDGVAILPVTPSRGGSFEIKAEATDERGNVVNDLTEIYVGDAGFEDQMTGTAVTITLDKKQYKQGEAAKALIRCPKPGGYALLTVEGEQIYTTQVIHLEKEATTVSLPVLEVYAPNAFVAVAYVREKKFYEGSKRLNVDLGLRKLNVKVSSDKPSYNPGEQVRYTIKTETSSGIPVPAEVSLSVVDESIYAIYEDQYNLAEGFYPKRYNAVETLYSFPDLYLGGADKAPTNIQIRKKFVDTAYWNPAIQTNNQGEATVSVQLPDNLTSWRATVRGVTADTSVGETKGNITARKDLMLRLEAPVFLTATDQQRLAAVVSNNTGSDADVHVAITANGTEIAGDTNKTVHVANGRSETVELTLSPGTGGIANIEGKAWIAGGASDGMVLSIPLKSHGRTFVDRFAGMASGNETVKLMVKDNADPNAGRVVLTLAPTLASTLLKSLDELVGFPYGCTEQTTSRFLPTVLVSKAVQDAGLPKPKLNAQIPRIVEDSYNRLAKMQHSDGGWGWWEYDASEPYMTAYVLEAIYRAGKAGFEPKMVNTTKAVEWGSRFLENPGYPREFPGNAELRRRTTDALYMTYALSLFDGKQAAAQKLGQLNLNSLTAAQCAYAAMAYNNLGESYKAKRDAVVQRLISLARSAGGTVNWDEDYWGYETTGRCLLALQTIQPNHPYVAKAMYFLMLKRQGETWYSTRDTSAILIALTQYVAQTKELAHNTQVTLLLNGQELSKLTFDPTLVDQPQTRIELPMSRLIKGENQLQLQTSSGVAYYTVDLRQYAIENGLMPPVNLQEVQVDRRYYVMEAQRMEDGTTKLMPSKKPVDSAKVGDIIRAEVTVTNTALMQYVIVEDPTPSSCRVTEREDVTSDDWTWWWARTSVLDDRVSFFADSLPSGSHKFTYSMRVENPGRSVALPTAVYNMYDPYTKASGGENLLQVGAK